MRSPNWMHCQIPVAPPFASHRFHPFRQQQQCRFGIIALPDCSIQDLANPAQRQQLHPQSHNSARCIFRHDEHHLSRHRSVTLRHHNISGDIVAADLQGRWQWWRAAWCCERSGVGLDIVHTKMQQNLSPMCSPNWRRCRWHHLVPASSASKPYWLVPWEGLLMVGGQPLWWCAADICRGSKVDI